MAHGLRSSYMDFINWYWDQRVYGFIGNTTNVSQDCLCKLVIKETGDFSCWNVFAASNSYFFKDLYQKERYSGSEVFQEIKQHPETFMVEYSPFFETILQSIESKGWVDIENDYYQLLKDSINMYELRVSVADNGALDLSEAEKEIIISVVLSK